MDVQANIFFGTLSPDYNMIKDRCHQAEIYPAAKGQLLFDSGFDCGKLLF